MGCPSLIPTPSVTWPAQAARSGGSDPGETASRRRRGLFVEAHLGLGHGELLSLGEGLLGGGGGLHGRDALGRQLVRVLLLDPLEPLRPLGGLLLVHDRATGGEALAGRTA